MRVRNASLAVFAFSAVGAFGDVLQFPWPPEKTDPSMVAVTNEFPGAWHSGAYSERLRILVDFDFDGHDDMILSEPLQNFGTGGGCWTVYHWTNGTYQAIGDVGAHRTAWSIEKDPQEGYVRFWYYWHSSARTGMLGYDEIEPTRIGRKEKLYLTFDDDENCLASKLYKAALGDHGVKYRFEASATTNGVVTWRAAKK